MHGFAHYTRFCKQKEPEQNTIAQANMLDVFRSRTLELAGDRSLFADQALLGFNRWQLTRASRAGPTMEGALLVAYAYDDQNIFAKILRGEIPNNTVLETEHSLAFRDIAPQAPVHVLVIPKAAYVSYDHFAAEASDAEIVDFNRAIAQVCRSEGVSLDGSDGFRLISNAGAHGVQEVPHLHVHVLGGRSLGRMLAKEDSA